MAVAHTIPDRPARSTASRPSGACATRPRMFRGRTSGRNIQSSRSTRGEHRACCQTMPVFRTRSRHLTSHWSEQPPRLQVVGWFLAYSYRWLFGAAAAQFCVGAHYHQHARMPVGFLRWVWFTIFEREPLRFPDVSDFRPEVLGH